MSTYVDMNGGPAICLAFGYSPETVETTRVLGIRTGRVRVFRMTPEAFDAEFTKSDVPFPASVLALKSIAMRVGCDLEARLMILSFLNAPAWRIKHVLWLLVVQTNLKIWASLIQKRLREVNAQWGKTDGSV